MDKLLGFGSLPIATRTGVPTLSRRATQFSRRLGRQSPKAGGFCAALAPSATGPRRVESSTDADRTCSRSRPKTANLVDGSLFGPPLTNRLTAVPAAISVPATLPNFLGVSLFHACA